MTPQNSDARFWRSDKPYSTIFSNIKRIRMSASSRLASFSLAVAMYDDADFTGLGMLGGFENSSDISPALSLNCVKPAVDTLTTMLTKARPLPMATTSGGTYNQQKRARLLSQAIEGQFTESGVWETNFQIVRNAALTGTGFAYVYRVGDKIHYDSVFPWEVFVDPRDSYYGKPRTLYLVRLVDKLVLKDMFPKTKVDIEKSDVYFGDYVDRSLNITGDSVVVCEAWHLPSGPDAGDGYHFISVSNGDLLKEKYEYDEFPLIPLYVMPPSAGFFGCGLARQLTGIQYTTNVLAQRCQRHAELAPSYLFVPKGSDVEMDSLTNSEWSTVAYNPGYRPDVEQPQPFPPQLWEFVKQVYGMAFDVSGVSQTAAQADLPKALREASGIAMRLHNENRYERFNVAAKLYSKFCIKVAWRMIDLFEEIVKDGGKAKVRTSSKQGAKRILSEIDYKKVRLDREEFVLEVWDTNLLKEEPVMKAASVEALINSKLITQEEGRLLLDFPDLDRFNSVNRAKYDVLDEILDKMYDDDVPVEDAYTAPEPLFDLNLALTKALQAYNAGVRDKEPEERLQLVRQFIEEVQEQLSAMGAQEAPPPEGQPQTQETGLTVSELSAATAQGQQ